MLISSSAVVGTENPCGPYWAVSRARAISMPQQTVRYKGQIAIVRDEFRGVALAQGKS